MGADWTLAPIQTYHVAVGGSAVEGGRERERERERERGRTSIAILLLYPLYSECVYECV